MQALQIVPGKLFEGFERRAARDAGIEIETDVRSRPARKRTAQDFHTELREGETAKISEDVACSAQLSQHRLGLLRLGDKLQPLTRLEDSAVSETVETLPVSGLDVDGMKLHGFSGRTVNLRLPANPFILPGAPWTPCLVQVNEVNHNVFRPKVLG